MEINIYTILYTLGIGILGYFLRDVYKATKKRFVKGDKPKTTLNYSYHHKSTSGTYPRTYTFKSSLLFKNIDTEPIYEITINQVKNGKIVKLKNVDNLIPNKEILIEDQLEIPFEDTGSKPKEAEKILPEIFRIPQLIVVYKDKNGHSYKSKLNK